MDDSTVSAVLARYGPIIRGLRWESLGSAGGFSGARIWRGDDAAISPLLALKSWPESMTAAALGRIHGWMHAAMHLGFVPRVLRNVAGSTATLAGGRVWDLCRWQPGEVVRNPSDVQLVNACSAIAALHRSWAPTTMLAPCPGVRNRLRLFEEYRCADSRGDALRSTTHPRLEEAVSRADELLARLLPSAEAALRLWNDVRLPLQPCVRDLRREHLLFTNSEVTGVIDFGAMAFDHVAVDLARFLGEALGDEVSGFSDGLAAYRDAGGKLAVPDEFVHLLSFTGLLGSLIRWIFHFSGQGHTAQFPDTVAMRFLQLLLRCEKMGPL